MTIQMKAGEYYIGDCCYVLKEEYLENFDWVDDFCFYIDEEEVYVLGHKVAVFGTMYGDGEYENNIGFDFPVDAGIIGCTPKELWKGSSEPFGCKLVDFKTDFVCWENKGTIVFGHVVIETADDEYD
ncbi:hypothetical protein D3C85_344760 [compost metagenome]